MEQSFTVRGQTDLGTRLLFVDFFKLFEIMVNDDAPSLRCCIGRQENIVVVDESMLNLFDKCLDFLLLQLFGL